MQMIRIAATFTSEPVEASIAFWLEQLGIEARVEFAPYNQVFQELLDPASLLGSNPGGLNVALVRLEDWSSSEDGTADLDAIARAAGEFASALKAAAARSKSPHLAVLCPPSPAFAKEHAAFCASAEKSLADALGASAGVYLVRPSEISRLYPVESWYDARGDKDAKMPYTEEYFAALGTMVARRFRAMLRPAAKVLVLDCDNTLWSGVCGEVGAAGVVVDGPRRAFQEFVVEQHAAGMLICLCSKNVEEDVLEVFKTRKDMPLTLDHLTAWKVNWSPKSANIAELASQLSLGLDSFVFVDDDDVQCAEVRANCPGVLVIQVPKDPAGLRSVMEHTWAFDRLRVTEEDRNRSLMYKQDFQREEARKSAMSLDDFLAGLELRISIAPMKPDQLQRAAQLTQKTNQFNLTTVRRTEAELKALLEAGGHRCLVVSVKDRFGDYGLVGLVIYRAAEELRVDTMLLSCRALGRKVEHEMLAALGRLAAEAGSARVAVPFAPTAKNKPAADFLDEVGKGLATEEAPGRVYRFTPAQAAALGRPAEKAASLDKFA